MLVATKDRPLATTTTGALPRPRWFTEQLRGRPFSEAMSEIAFREQYLDCQAAFLSDQARAGLDVMTDGDARFDDGVAGRHWIDYVTERLAGMGRREVADYPIHRGKRYGEIMWEVMETRVPPAVTGPIGRGRLEYDIIWKTSQALAAKPVKFGAITGQLVETSVNNRHYADRRELALELSAALNAEYLALAEAGCPAIQLEEPCIHGIAGTTPGAMLDAAFYVEAFNREARGLRAVTEVWCHTCWGSPAAQRTRARSFSYQAALPYLDRLEVDVLTFEGKETEGAEFEIIAKVIDPAKKIALGVVSHRTLQIERPEEVAALIRSALRWMPPERLILTSDCGFGRQGMSRLHAFYKMVALVEGANIVRRELGLSEAEVRAADPRFAWVRPG